MTAKKNEKALAEAKNNLPTTAAALESFAGQGFEQADASAFAIPFLRILQSNSPQVNEDDESYIKGAKPGMFYNSVTGETFGKEILVIPFFYARDFIEWLPNRGGFVCSHGKDPAILQQVTHVDERNNQFLPNGNVIQDFRNHYILLPESLNSGPMVFSLASTGIKHSRKWMTMMSNLMLPDSNYKAPMFGAVWRIGTVLNKNDDGQWYQIGDKTATNVKFERWISSDELTYALSAKKMMDRITVDYSTLADDDKEEKEVF